MLIRFPLDKGVRRPDPERLPVSLICSSESTKGRIP